MSILENRRKYRELIGEYITAFAEIEFYMSLYDAMIKNQETYKVDLVTTFATPLKVKIKHIRNFIKEQFSVELFTTWQLLEAEILDLNQSRSYLVHGTGFSDFWAPTIKTMLDVDQKNQQLQFKEFNAEDLRLLCERVYHVLTGENGIQGVFLQALLSEMRGKFGQDASSRQ